MLPNSITSSAAYWELNGSTNGAANDGANGVANGDTNGFSNGKTVMPLMEHLRQVN